jgi:hypothetical protein
LLPVAPVTTGKATRSTGKKGVDHGNGRNKFWRRHHAKSLIIQTFP